MTVAFIIKINMPGDDTQQLADVSAFIHDILDSHLDVVSVEPWQRGPQPLPQTTQQTNQQTTQT